MAHNSPDWQARHVGRDLPLQFLTPKLAMSLTKGGHCPTHDDAHPSFSAKWGREPGTTIIACAKCSHTKEGQDELLAHFRKLGYRLGPMRMASKRLNRPVVATTSVAWRALTPSERRMYEQIYASDDALTYNDFVAEGISKSAVSVGLKALQALGFLGVKRSPRKRGCKRYERNLYQIERRWRNYEPDSLSKAVKAAAVESARTVARAARKGGEDISGPVVKKRSPQASGNRDLRILEVRVRGSDFGTATYVDEDKGTLSQDSLRPANLGEGEHTKSGESRARPAATPSRHCDDPGPTSEDAYGFAPPQSVSYSLRRVEGWRPPCGGYGCGSEGECLRPGACRGFTG